MIQIVILSCLVGLIIQFIAFIIYVISLVELKETKQFKYKQKRFLQKSSIIEGMLVIPMAITGFNIFIAGESLEVLKLQDGIPGFIAIFAFIPYYFIFAQIIGFIGGYFGKSMTMYILHFIKGGEDTFLHISKAWGCVLIGMAIIFIPSFFVIDFNSQTWLNIGAVYSLIFIAVNIWLLQRGIALSPDTSKDKVKKSSNYNEANQKEINKKDKSQKKENSIDTTLAIGATIFNILLPGAGSLLLKKFFQGTVQLGILLLAVLGPIFMDPSLIGSLLLLMLLIGCWIWGIVTGVLATIQE